MDQEQEKALESKEAQAATTPAEPEENVVSVWYGSGNTKWFRRRHFEGYTQYETLEPNGKKVLHHVYTGYYYTQELDQEGRMKHRIVYFGFALMSAALLLFASTRYAAVNIHWPGGVPAFAGLFGLCWLLYGVVNDCIVPQKRTIGDYRASSLAIQRGGLVTVIACGVYALVAIGYAIVVRQRIGLHIVCVLAALVAGGLAFIVRWLESKVQYTQSRSELAGKYTM